MKKDKTRQLFNTYTGKEKIELFNRYYGKIYLEPISEDSYQLIGPENIYTFMRIGFKDLGKARTDYTNIQFIDPDGGPYISVGSIIGTHNEVITNIICVKVEKKAVYIIEVKKEDQKD